MGLQKHVDWSGTTYSGIKALKVPFQIKQTKTLGWPKVKSGQNYPKTTFYFSTSNLSYSVIFVKFN